jgi:hypothetical protein
MSIVNNKSSRKFRFIIVPVGSIAILMLVIGGFYIFKTSRMTIVQFDIHQNKGLIRLSTYSEPPQFAIWMENAKDHQLKTVFVTSRVSKGDWEGKPNVPVALPRWVELFKGKPSHLETVTNEEYSAVTGATPRDDYFSVQIKVEQGSEWICWIEMNLAGDYNDSFPEFDPQSLKEDQFSCGQPALLFKTAIIAVKGTNYIPVLEGQSIWEKGVNRIEPISSKVTTAKDIFDEIQISVIQPKPKLINKNRILNDK